MTQLPARKIVGYGHHKDAFDVRDHAFTAGAVTRLENQDLTPKLPPIWDQGRLGSCTAHGILRAFAFLHPGFMGSRLWLYLQERIIEGTVASDAGAEIRDGLQVLRKLGCPPEKDWAYHVTKFRGPAPAKATADAAALKLGGFQRVTGGINGFLDALDSGFPVVFGMLVYPEFESEEVARTGIVPMPDLSVDSIGGHCVCAAMHRGSGDSLQIGAHNSWGPKWGDQGRFWLPAGYFTKRGLINDAWVLRA